MRRPLKKARKGTMPRLLKFFFSSYKLPLVAVLICMLFNTLAGVCPGIFQQTILENVDKALTLIKGGASTESAAEQFFPAITAAVIVLVCIYAVGLVAGFIYQRTMAVITQSFLNKLRNIMFAKMQKLPIKYFDTHTHGDIMSHYTNDIDTLRQLVSQSIPQLIISALTLTAVLFLMLYYSLWMTLIVLVGVVAMALVTKYVGGGSAKYFVKQQKALGKAEGYIEEMIHGQKVVKVFCHEDKSISDFDKLNTQLCKDATSANSYANILMPIMNNIGHILYALIIFVGGVLVLINIDNISISGKPLDISTLIPFIGFSKQFTMNISQLSNQINAIAMGLAGADRMFELMDEEPEVDNGYVTLVNAREAENGELTESEERTGIWAWKHPHEDGTVTYTRVQGDVRLTEVDFGYVEDKIVLHDITLYAKPGQKIAFVGATGAGKTTITNLINRFYDIADGKIRYDGININKIKKDDLRASLGIVLQDVNLFTGTVMDNIRYGKLDATDEECINAAKRANAHSFISMLPDGYNTVLKGDGSGLSQGQRQLISIARAAVADPPVMILDEATSSIDTRTEAIVSAGMDALMQGRTVFVIAHRLSTIKNSDVIMVLDKGRIIERGSHDDLIAAKGKYYQLYTGSFDFDEQTDK
ncbi:MAG: ABC transporter ATP-binding protein [Clostridia bacterium]|nr:ABC transporter ATP-binding protein [Clostridia bacterium]